MRSQLDRQRVRGEDFVAHGIGKGDLRRRDQVQRAGVVLRRVAAPRHREHVGLELRQLGRADERIGVDQIGRIALDIAMLPRMRVEHQLRECAMQVREIVAQEREARAGEPRRRREIEHAQRLAEIGVVPGREFERGRLAIATDLDVVVALSLIHI